MDEINYTLNVLAETIDARYTVGFPDAYQIISRLCQTLVLKLPLMGYLSRKLQVESGYLGRSPIWLVLHSDKKWTDASCQKLRLVLEAGSNPNESITSAIYSTTTWGEFLSEILPKIQPGGSPRLLSTPSSPKWLSKASPKFQDALESGLIQTFLDYGANSCVEIRLDSDNAVSAFTLFVAAACDIDWNEQAEEMYFKSLTLMIDRGASFDTPNRRYAAARPWGLEETLIESTVETMGEHHEILFGRLEEKLDVIKEPSQSLFIARLIQKILPCAIEACWPLKNHQHLIKRAIDFQKQSSSSCSRDLNTRSKRGSGLLGHDDRDRQNKRRLFGGY